jgi:Secretion system C-terminal sorting domain
MRRFSLFFTLLFIFFQVSQAQLSVARKWNNVLIQVIQDDLARPPVQARNLFHVSLAMYDAWAAYDAVAKTYLLGKTVGGVNYPFTGVAPVAPASLLEVYRNKAISYAAYRVIANRYANSPNWATSLSRINLLMSQLGYATSYTSTNYTNNDPADLGNYIGQKVIEMGLADGARQANNYAPLNYSPINTPLNVSNVGNSIMENPNRWQPLFITGAIDQNGNVVPPLQRFVCPEWGRVLPFAMNPASATIYTRDGANYPVYYDPGTPPMLDTLNPLSQSSLDFKWGHTMVAAWSSHLDPSDPTMIDISPNGLGNISTYPTNIAGQQSFYNFTNGGDGSTGYTLNPITGLPYTPQMVKRGDYTRIVSQYWADGPSSETPPGHWFVLLNQVSDKPGFQKKFEGVGPVLPNLEWDVKSYFALGASMHDVAIACWSIKGWYDTPRPISAIRKMALYGQSSNNLLPSYHAGGLPLIPGFIELVNTGDPLAGPSDVNVNKIKIKAWRGYSFITNPITDVAGVGWILAESWMPYQRNSFVTPPFGGYLSGHSTYSRAGAQSLTLLTGSPYFPGGLGEFIIPANSGFLGLEAGPSTTIKLQWASYKDASDQASLSRIWGGIHPAFDDMPGRAIGEQVGTAVHNKAKAYFTGSIVPIDLISFEAKEKNCTVQINWSTASEYSSKSYAIMRSEDGVRFTTKIGEVSAAGFSNTKHDYSFVDEAPMANNYYRLSQMDIDGKVKLLPIANVNMKNCLAQSDFVSNISPNPVVDKINFTIKNASKNEDVQIVISDALGRNVIAQTQKLQSGINNLFLDVRKLSVGTHFVKITFSGGKTFVQKIVKVKA